MDRELDLDHISLLERALVRTGWQLFIFRSLRDSQCSDFSCCNLQLADLHALVEHVEEQHVNGVCVRPDSVPSLPPPQNIPLVYTPFNLAAIPHYIEPEFNPDPYPILIHDDDLSADTPPPTPAKKSKTRISKRREKAYHCPVGLTAPSVLLISSCHQTPRCTKVCCIFVFMPFFSSLSIPSPISTPTVSNTTSKKVLVDSRTRETQRHTLAHYHWPMLSPPGKDSMWTLFQHLQPHYKSLDMCGVAFAKSLPSEISFLFGSVFNNKHIASCIHIYLSLFNSE